MNDKGVYITALATTSLVIRISFAMTMNNSFVKVVFQDSISGQVPKIKT